VARELISAGWPNARAIIGGWTAWQGARRATQPKPDGLVSLSGRKA
jgi:hypothetical protein